ncbi:efflux RND transporter periplasmic adaptor subunit [Thermophagus sp. OGC60D27]|uniref:efflux RND transporter periplasmic adaptor subunit n=1 Tax=Thermophagus sp. OGC60D27 TaxID=3458415 RepID=UPI004038436E
MNRIIISSKFLLFFVILTVTACSGKSLEQRSSVPVAKTDRVTHHHNFLTKSYPARIKTSSDIRLSFRVAGPIIKVLVDEGDFVKKGDLIAQLDPRDYELQLKGTEAKYQEVKAEVERITALYKKGKVSDNDYDKAVSGLKQITALYKSHKNSLTDTKLTAPFSGTITKVFFEEGETVDAGMPIVSLSDTKKLEIIVHLPAEDYLKKESFITFTCQNIHHPEQEWPLTLKGMVAQSNVNGLYPAYFQLSESSDKNLLPGMSVRVIIHYKSDQGDYFSVPSTAVFRKNGKAHIWKVDTTNYTIKAVPVNIHRIDNKGNAIINSPLIPNDIIVSKGVHSLREGDKIRELKPPSKSNIGNLL